MNTHKLFLILLALASLSCNAVVDEQSLEESPLIEYEGISICVSEATTRTAIDPDDMESVEWLSDDCIYLWAQDTEAETYSFEAAEFKQKYFHESYSQAVFIADVDPMSSGTYTYFGVYPKPTSVSGSQVSYTLSSEQSGLYDGELDIMVANPITGGALSEIPDVDLALSFSHLTHAVRINIPDNRNLFGQGVKQLEVTFPGDVVGDLLFDAASNAPTPSLSNGSSVVTLNFEEELNEGDQYAWIFIAPCKLDGTLSFRAYDNAGQMSEIISVSISKEMEAGRITPITLTVPSMLTKSYLNFTIGNNNLGEDVETITITAPSEALFDNGLSSVTLPISDNNEYSVSYNTADYGAKFKAGSITVSFESENAIVSCDPISLSEVVENNIVANLYACDVPYLMSNDFSSVNQDFEYYTDPGLSSASHYKTTLDAYGLTGWTADRCGGVTQTSIRTMARMEGSYIRTTYEGRIDSAPLSAIKDGKGVKIKVTYNYSGSKNEYAGSEVGTAYYTHGYTTTSGTISGSTSISTKIGSNMATGEDGSYTNITSNGSFSSTSTCGNTTRISWLVGYIDRDREFATGGNYWLYIDNVKVQIAN